MRNLRLIDKNVIPCSLLSQCLAATVEGAVLYFVSEDQLCRLNLELSNPKEDHVEILVPLGCDLGARVLDLKFLPEENVIALVFESGSVSTFNIDTEEIEIVGDVSGGISSCSWSPDMETLVIITKTGNVLLMTRTWDVLNEVALFQEDFGEGKFVTVGWGSKETQFHGSEGKDSRVKKEIRGKLSDWDDKSSRVVWRADGLFFAVNAISPSLGHRFIRTFNREGQLQYTSETVEQLEQSLSWKSSGASGLITSTISLVHQGKQFVAFFEKNGLRHGEFEITPGFKVLESYWNGDSTILALLVETSPGQHTMQLWTCSNYHWSMKQKIHLHQGLKPRWMSWDPIEANRLHLISASGEYVKMDYHYAVDRSGGSASSDLACVAVIDKNSVKLTLLREAVIPPPMCAWEVEMADSVNHVIFHQGDSNQFCVITDNGRISTFKWLQSDAPSQSQSVKIHRREGRTQQPSLMAEYVLNSEQIEEMYHWKWIDESTLAACLMNKVNIFKMEGGGVALRNVVELEKRIIQLVPCHDRLLLVQTDGKVMKLRLEDADLSYHDVSLPEPCCQADVVRGRLIALAASGRLYCDGQELLNTISSYVIHSDFLLVTSVQNHQLGCLPLENLDRCSADVRFQRRIERGAKLVHAASMASAVVLQMPRGNLEAVHPRALILNILNRLIDGRSFSEAFDLMKKQRINLNLLYDHDPHEWLENCPEFIEQISRSGVANLNLFLSELQEEDFTRTMYQDHYRDKTITPPGDKVNLVCNEMRKVMETTDRAKYLLPILTSHVRQDQLHLALKTVQMVDTESVKDDALKYLTVLVDTSKLYNEALATYDLQLSLMVANRSRMDPKEYLPFLNQLDAMEDVHLRKFTIDNHLKRYESAVRHLCHCKPVRSAEIFTFMKLHRLYAPVVDEICSAAIPDAQEVLQKAANLQADVLMARSNFEEAGYVLQRAGLNLQALSAFQQGGLWNHCTSLAAVLNLQEPETTPLISDLIKNLKVARKYREAAHLCEYFLKDYVQSAQCLVEGLCFSEAWALTARHSLVDFRETLRSSLMDSVQMMHERLVQVTTECGAYTSRLSVVRQNLLQKRENPPPEADHGDVFSETGSSIFTASGSSGVGSGKTFRSSKNRRKLERKKLQLKEGSAFEDLALIHQLYQIFVSTSAILVDLGSVLRGGLLILQDWRPLQQLQRDGDRFVKFMESKKKEIWNFQPLKKDEETDKTYGPSSTAETIISQMQKDKEDFFAVRYLELEPKMRYQPEGISDDWKLEVLK